MIASLTFNGGVSFRETDTGPKAHGPEGTCLCPPELKDPTVLSSRHISGTLIEQMHPETFDRQNTCTKWPNILTIVGYAAGSHIPSVPLLSSCPVTLLDGKRRKID